MIHLINQNSGSLRNFSERNGLYNFSCPYCGDSAHDTTKARGYLFKKSDEYFYKCHNCDISRSLKGFVKDQFPEDYQSEVLLGFKSRERKHNNYNRLETKTNEIDLDELSKEHLEYLKNRRLDDVIDIKQVFKSSQNFMLDISKWNPSKYIYKGVYKDPRIVLPIIRDFTTIGYIGRSLIANPKYINASCVDDCLVYGLDNLNHNRPIFVVEGAIDSMFLDNSIAALSSSLDSKIPKYITNPILIWDNEPHNPQIVEKMRKAIQANFQVFIPPFKQINDLNDWWMKWHKPTKELLQQLILENTYSGLSASLKLTEWLSKR
jgi:hypothetical protein